MPLFGVLFVIQVVIRNKQRNQDMEIAKYIFIIVASITLFGLIGGLSPDITVTEMALKAVIVGLVFATGIVLKEAKTVIFSKIS